VFLSLISLQIVKRYISRFVLAPTLSTSNTNGMVRSISKFKISRLQFQLIF
jgi:hypothetical protein